MKRQRRIIKMLVAIVVLLNSFSLFSLSFQECKASEVLYERDFDGGFVTVAVGDSIVFSITQTEGSRPFCDVPQRIKQRDNLYEISTDQQGEGYIKIEWSNFSGCGDLYAGQTAIGSMSEFPSSFNLGESFIIYCGIWAHGDYFVIDPATSTTTTSLTTSTSIPSGTTSALTTTFIPPFCLIEQLYGEHAQETDLLRYVRDNILSTTGEGRELIRLYYQWSHILAETLQEDETFREEVKAFIDELIFLIKAGSGLPI
jgi:hypothetical protein